MKPRKNRLILAAASTLLLAPAVFAGNTWDGGASPDGNWSNDLNWDADTGPNYATPLLTFAGTTGLTSNNDEATSILGMAFSSGAGAFTIGGNSVTLSGNITNSSTSLQTINLPLVLDAQRTITTANGNITLGGQISGAYTLVKGGVFTLTMNTAGSSFSRLQINTGIVKLGVNDALPTTAGLTTATGASGGTLDLNGKTQTLGGTITIAGTVAGTVTINDTAGGGLLKLGNDVSQNGASLSNVTISAALDLNGATRTFTLNNATTTFNVSGVISNSGPTAGLTKAGVGALTLSGANTYNGDTRVNAGLLTLSNSQALQNSTLDTANSIASSSATTGLKTTVTTLTLGGLSGDKNLASLFDSTNGYVGVTALTLNPASVQTPSYSGVIADGAIGMTLTKTGAGTQTLTGPNTYTGATTVSAGTLTLGASGVIADSSVVNLNAGTLNTTDGVVESLHSIQATAGTLLLGNTNTTGSADITLLNNSVLHNINVGVNGTLRLASGKTLTQTATGVTGQLAAGDTFTLDIGSGALAHLSGNINAGGFDGAVVKTGSGTLRLTGASSQWGGNTLINNGILEFNTIGNYDVLSSLGDGDNGGANDAIIRIGSATTAATLKMIETQTANSSNRAFQLGDAGGTIEVVESTQTLTLSGIVSNAGTSGALTKTGAGRLVLSGPNTYSGGTIMNAGTLNYGNASALSTGAITFAGGSILQAGVATTLANNIIVNESVVGTVGTAGFTTTLSGAITGAGILAKGGGGSLTLTGGLANTIAGGFRVTTGRLVVNDGLSLTNVGPVTVLSGASLNYSKNFAGNNLTNNLTLSGSGDGTYGSLNLWGGADATGTITLDADATISHDFNTATISGSITGTNRNLNLTTLTTVVAQPGMTVSGPISLGTGGLTVTGVANTGGFSIRLTGANSYSGGTTVTAGTLQVNNTTGSGTGSGTVTVNSGATLGGTGTIAGSIIATGSIAPGTTGIGTLKAGGDVTWNSGNAWKFDLSATGNTSDKLEITGALTKGSGTSFIFDFLGSTPDFGRTFTLASFASSTFSVSDFDLAGSLATLGAGSYAGSSFMLNSTSLTFTTIPEPTTAFAGLLLALGLLRRRR